MSELDRMEEKTEFVVTDDATAQWCIKKIREAEQTKEMWRKHYDDQLERVNATADNSIAYFTAKLEEYFLTVPHKMSKTQESYTLPGGKLVRKTQLPKYDVDDDALVPWLEDDGRVGLIKTKKTADWATLKKSVTISPDGQHVVTADGEIVPGVKVTIRPDLFKVEMEDYSNE